MMRKPADWMSQADERILEAVRDNGNLPPQSITDSINAEATDLEYSSAYIQQRCALLADNGLLTKYGRGVYSITQLGHEFLAEDVDVGAPDEE